MELKAGSLVKPMTARPSRTGLESVEIFLSLKQLCALELGPCKSSLASPALSSVSTGGSGRACSTLPPSAWQSSPRRHSHAQHQAQAQSVLWGLSVLSLSSLLCSSEVSKVSSIN